MPRCYVNMADVVALLRRNMARLMHVATTLLGYDSDVGRVVSCMIAFLVASLPRSFVANAETRFRGLNNER